MKKYIIVFLQDIENSSTTLVNKANEQRWI